MVGATFESLGQRRDSTRGLPDAMPGVNQTFSPYRWSVSSSCTGSVFPGVDPADTAFPNWTLLLSCLLTDWWVGSLKLHLFSIEVALLCPAAISVKDAAMFRVAWRGFGWTRRISKVDSVIGESPSLQQFHFVPPPPNATVVSVEIEKILKKVILVWA